MTGLLYGKLGMPIYCGVVHWSVQRSNSCSAKYFTMVELHMQAISQPTFFRNGKGKSSDR